MRAAQGPNEVESHLAELRAVLDGKDPRRAASKARGAALLVLTGDDGAIHRVRIALDPKRVTVTAEGGGPEDGRDFAVVRGRFRDWLTFFRAASEETLRPLRLYGDVEIISAIGEILSAQRSSIDIRARGRR
jgi:hypothetical protein